MSSIPISSVFAESLKALREREDVLAAYGLSGKEVDDVAKNFTIKPTVKHVMAASFIQEPGAMVPTFYYHPELELVSEEKQKPVVLMAVHESAHLVFAQKRRDDHVFQYGCDIAKSKPLLYISEIAMTAGLVNLAQAQGPWEWAASAGVAVIASMGLRYVLAKPVRSEERDCDEIATIVTGEKADASMALRNAIKPTDKSPLRFKAENWFRKNMPGLYKFYDPLHPSDQDRMQNVVEKVAFVSLPSAQRQNF